MIGDHLALVSHGDGWPKDTGRLRQMQQWAEDNPPESGIVPGSIQRDPHGRFWQGVALKAADAAVLSVGGKA